MSSSNNNNNNDKKPEMGESNGPEKVNPYDPEVIKRKKIIIAEMVKNGKAIDRAAVIENTTDPRILQDNTKLIYNPNPPTKADLALMEECYIQLNKDAISTFNYYYGNNTISPLQLNQMLGANYCAFLNEFASAFPEPVKKPLKTEAVAHLFGMLCHILDVNPVDAIPPEVYEELKNKKDDNKQ